MLDGLVSGRAGMLVAAVDGILEVYMEVSLLIFSRSM